MNESWLYLALGAAIGLLLLLWQFRRLMLIGLLLRLRFKVGTPPRRVDTTELPEYLRALFSGYGAGLHALGFQTVSTLAQPPMLASDPRRRLYTQIFWQPEHGVLAQLEVDPQLLSQPMLVSFFSFFGDQRCLMTGNRLSPQPLPRLSGTRVEDPCADDLNEQWLDHLHNLAEANLRRPALKRREDALAQMAQRAPGPYLAQLQRQGHLKASGAGLLRLSLPAVWRGAAALLRPPATVARAHQRPFRTPQPVQARHLLRAQLDQVANQVALTHLEWTPGFKAVLLALGLGLAGLAWLLGSPGRSLVALGGVVLLHEAGHWLAMRLMGWQDAKLFFLPLLGQQAPSTGRRPHPVPLWQQALAHLAGPLPGLLLGLALLAWPADGLDPATLAWLRALAAAALGFNLLSLLPWPGLDGGRLLELATLGRWPHARAGLVLAWALLMLPLAAEPPLAWHSWPFLAAMGLLLLAVPLLWQAASLARTARQRLSQQSMTSTRPSEAERRRHGAPQAPTELLDALALSLHAGGLDIARLKPRARLLQQARAMQAFALLVLPMARPRLGLLALGLHAALLLGGLLVVLNAGSPGTTWPLLAPSPAEQAQRVIQARQPTAQASEANSPGPRLSPAQQATLRNELQARYAALSDPAERWAVLAPLDRDRPEASAALIGPQVPDGFWNWVEAQRAELRPLLPPGHAVHLANELARIKPPSPAWPTRLQNLLRQLAPQGAAQAANLDPERFGLLLAALDLQARQSPQQQAPALVASSQALLQGLWQLLQAPEHPLYPQRSQVAATLSRFARSAGQAPAAWYWMDLCHDSAPASQRPLRHLQRAWLWLDTQRLDAAGKAATQGTQATQADDPSSYWPQQWQSLAGWVLLQRGQRAAAIAHFEQLVQAEDQRWHQQREAQLQALPWWQRLGQWGQEPPERPMASRLSLAQLDQLAALQATEPYRANAELLSWRHDLLAAPPEVLRQAMATSSQLESELRRNAHAKVLQVMQPPGPAPLPWVTNPP